MAHYSPRGFLRQASNALLQQYFESKGFDLNVDWALLDETKIDTVWEAWQTLSSEQQGTADADFADVSRLANDAGLGALIQESTWHNVDLPAAFEAFEDHTDMVLWVLINYPDLFRVGALFFAADAISSRSWQKWKSLPEQKPFDDQAACDALGASLADYYRKNEGRGRHCKVEVYQRAGRYYYFVFPEDYARAEQDFDETGELVRRTHRPAFQLVFVYSPDAGTLDASAPGGRVVVQKLMGLAMAVLMGADDRPDQKDDRVYDLEGLRHPDPMWIYPASSGIVSVWVKALRLTFKATKDRLVIEANEQGRAHHVYERLTGSDGKPGRVDPESVFVTQAQIRVEYAPQGGRSVASRDIRVTWPNSCSLGQDHRDHVLREMLINSGIDPQAIGRDRVR